MKRLLKIVAGLLALWMTVLFVVGLAIGDRTGRKVGARIGETLQATSTVRSASVGLVLGSLVVEGLSVRRHDLIGQLALDVGEVRCDLPPLGLALVDRSCGDLEVSTVRLEVSTAALFKLQRPKRAPFRADRVIIDNAELTFSASAFLPSLGRIHIKIEHAEAGPTTFKTPLSWLFALRTLRAAIDLPAGITLRLTYANGKLGAAGSVFGSTPVELPVSLPAIDSADDAHAEIKKLVTLARDLAERLVAQRAEDWLKSKLP